MTMIGECAHCALPLGRQVVHGTVAGVRGSFCCYGCLLAQQVTRARGEAGAAAAIVVRLGVAIFFAMNVMMLSLPTYAAYVYGPAADGPLLAAMRVLAMIFSAPVLVLLGGPILASAWCGARGGGPNADALIVLGTGAAYVLSTVNVLAGRSDVYFDVAAMLLVLVTLGRYLEARARAEAGAIVAATLAPAPADAVRLRGAARESVPAAVLVPDDVIEVGPGAMFPTDGILKEGTGGIDEATLTGESMPVVKGPGDTVAGGTCSVDAVFRVRVTVAAAQSAVARISDQVRAARRVPSAAERSADRAARWLTPAAVLVAVVAAGWWSVTASPERGVLAALAVLVVACPCGLGIATPLAVCCGLAEAARRGIVLRSAPGLERAAAIRHVFFDKTGTLTHAVPRLVDIVPAAGSGLDRAALLARAAALEAGIGHPLAKAIVREARDRDLAVPPASEVRIVPGRGVRGRVWEEPVAVGGGALLAEEAPGSVMERGGGVSIGVAAGGRLLGTLLFAEALRPGAAEAMARLRRMGIRPGLLSGDAQADALVPEVFAPGEVALGLRPEEKVDRVRNLRARGVVAMVGDGINDAPALAAADLGVALADATDLARLSAEVVILGGDLRRIPWLFGYAGRVRRVVRQNLAWAFTYNFLAVAAAAAGSLNPIVASLAMLASSLVVVANAQRLVRRRADVAPERPADAPLGVLGREATA
jgi:Cu2+-exporting ATPase